MILVLRHWNRPELIRDYDLLDRYIVHQSKTNWNRPELIRDYDLSTCCVIQTLREYWNRPELIRDYDCVVLKCCLEPNRLLKQTWIDKGLRPRWCTRPYGQGLHWNRPELIRDYDLGTGRDTIAVRMDWNRPELIRDYDPTKYRRMDQSALIETDLNW